MVQHTDCNEHWCENYGKSNGECDRCEKQTRSYDEVELLAFQRRKINEHIEYEYNGKKTNGQER